MVLRSRMLCARKELRYYAKTVYNFSFKLYDKMYTCGDVQKAGLEEFYW